MCCDRSQHQHLPAARVPAGPVAIGRSCPRTVTPHLPRCILIGVRYRWRSTRAGSFFHPPPHPLRRPKLVGLRHSLPTLELPFLGAVTQSAHLPWVAGAFQPLTYGSLPAVARDIAFAYGPRPKGRDTSDALNPANPCLLTSPTHANAGREALSSTRLRRRLVTKSL